MAPRKEDNVMKVLEVISSLAPMGGGETFAVNLCRGLSTVSDLKVVVLYKNNRSFFLNRLGEKGIKPFILDKKGHLDFKNANQLKKIILDFKPDVIHTENNALIPTFLALRKTKYHKTLNVFHTMHLVPEKECNNFFVRIMYKHIFKKKNYIPVAITGRLSKLASIFFNKNDVPVILNGADIESNNNLIPFCERKVDIVVVGRFSKEKNHQFIVKSLSELKKYLPNFKACFIGDGELLHDIKCLAENLNVDENIVFAGSMEKPSEIVNDSKIIVLASFYEASPLSLVEGMASGCIVASSNVGGVPDIIVDSKNGFLFDVGNEKEFVDILSNILCNPSNYQHISEHNFSYAQQFSVKKCVRDYLELFERRMVHNDEEI